MAIEDVYELAYREAVRALDRQLAALNELRGRASMLLATASIAISLLGQESFQGTRALGWAAIVCFALFSACMIAIVWPRGEWAVDIDPQALLHARLSADESGYADLTLDLIGHMTEQRDANSLRLAETARAFRIGASLLATQLVLTIAAGAAIV